MALKVEGDVTSYKGRFLAQRGQQTGFWDGVARKINDTDVTQNNLSKIRDLALQVFEAGAKT